ncbi:MAG: hypothetical protein LBE36_11880 [Flavobacteriaceae bacterium]|jgi:hypothetical protein|nr:hypothetical protein [Flavobacteriaceae bacterium]
MEITLQPRTKREENALKAIAKAMNIPIKKDDTLMSKEEFFTKIEQSRKQYKEGKFTRISNEEELEKYFEEL